MKLRTDYIKEELDQKYGQQMREKDDMISQMRYSMVQKDKENERMMSEMRYSMAQKDQENEKLRQYFIDHKIAMPL